VRPSSKIARNRLSEHTLNSLYRVDTLRDLKTMGLDGPLAPNCILLVKWERRSLACDVIRGWIYPGTCGGNLTAESQTTR